MITQEAITDLERVKAELGQSIQRKEREFGAVMAKIEDEASLGSKQQKQIKELSVSFLPHSAGMWKCQDFTVIQILREINSG